MARCWGKMDSIRHLYVHVPFCPTVCPFCSFDVLTRRSGQVDHYLSQVALELTALNDLHDFDLETVYFGGGTPTHLRPHELNRLVELVSQHCGWASSEATIEVHPLNVHSETPSQLVELGFNRLSLGAQSFDDAVLKHLGRPYNARVARESLDRCLGVGDLATIGVDIITAVDSQVVSADLEYGFSSGAHHVSAYTLTIEDGTPFGDAGMVVAEARQLEAFEAARSGALRYGFEHYEVSNFCRPGYQSLHNLAYWENNYFLGLGPSAASHLPAGQGLTVRTTNAPFQQWLEGALPREEPRTSLGVMTDAVFAGLRQLRGVDIGQTIQQSGIDPLEALRQPIARLVEGGLIAHHGERLRATEAGILVLDQVIATLFADLD